MKNINQWLDRISNADQEELDQIKEEWSDKGGEFHESDWPTFWDAFNCKRLELIGFKPTDKEF